LILQRKQHLILLAQGCLPTAHLSHIDLPYRMVWLSLCGPALKALSCAGLCWEDPDLPCSQPSTKSQLLRGSPVPKSRCLAWLVAGSSAPADSTAVFTGSPGFRLRRCCDAPMYHRAQLPRQADGLTWAAGYMRAIHIIRHLAVLCELGRKKWRCERKGRATMGAWTVNDTLIMNVNCILYFSMNKDLFWVLAATEGDLKAKIPVSQCWRKPHVP